jgi:uncharacterized repeat protein (TIGR01451 family)
MKSHPHPLPRTRAHIAIRVGVCLMALAVCSLLTFKLHAMMQPATPPSPSSASGAISPEVQAQIEAMVQEKSARTPTQNKIDSQLIYATKMERNEPIAPGVEKLDVDVPLDPAGLTVVDITVNGSEKLITKIKEGGGIVVLDNSKMRLVRAKVKLEQLEVLAALTEVVFIQPEQKAISSGAIGGAMPASEAADETVAGRPESNAVAAPKTTKEAPANFAERAERVRASLKNLLAKPVTATTNPLTPAFARPALAPAAMMIGSVTSQGDATHRAADARNTFGITGAGVKIGVLSDGVDGLAASQASGDLGTVTILPGQAGSGAEGTAMLEIIHDLAPDAELYFATAFGSITSFAQNIRDLRAAGCDIIVDDIRYFVESPFQDGQATGVVSNTNGGIVTQAVNDVTASGASYFSSAGNEGNKNDNTSGVWEGDFVDGGDAPAPIGAANGRVHDFGGGQLFNTLTVAGSGPLNLFWSDPLGASNNDYDLYRLNAAGTTIVAASTNFQTGTQDPYEQMTQSLANPRIVIVKFSGAARYLHLNTNRGRLSINTAGQTLGHNSAAAAFSVAATPSGPTKFNATDPPGPFPNPHNSTNIVETFSSDGPRRLFFQPNGTPFTPGNFSATGGILRQKPDITAADGVAVTGNGGFGTPFFGTSAAAPHAAAIAGLLKSANPALTPAQIRTILLNTAIDIEGAGTDRDSGAGIVMAFQALQSLGIPGFANPTLGTVTIAESPAGDGIISPGEAGTVTAQITNPGAATATNVVATLTTSTPGVTIQNPNSRAYGDIPVNGSATNTVPFAFSVASSAPCPLTVNFTLTVTFGGGLPGANPRVFTFSQTFSPPSVSITSTLDATAPTNGLLYTATSGTQNNRLNRNGVIPSCAAPKATPLLQEAGVGGTRRYDAYTFANVTGVTTCVTVTLSSACNAAAGSQLYLAAYNNTGFVPTAIQTNYLADRGVTTLGDQTIGFNVPAGQSFTVVIHEIVAGATNANACPYTLNVSGTGLGCTTAVTPTADLALTNTDSPDPIGTGANLTYTLNLTNNGPGAATNVTVSDPLPANTTFVSSSVVTGTGWASQAPPVNGTGTMLFSKPSMANGETASFQIVVKVNAPANTVVTNTATATTTSTDATPATATATTNVIPAPVLKVQAGGPVGAGIGDPAICLDPGGLVGVEATLTNPNNAALASSFTATLPIGVLTPVAGTCVASVNPGGCTIAGNQIQWNGVLNPGQTVSIIYRAQIAANVAPGAQICIDNQGIVGGVAANLQYCFRVICPGAAPRVSDQKPGSVLVFPYYTSTIGGGADTRLTITHTGGGTGLNYVHLFLIDGASCQAGDFFLCLTPGASFSFTASDYDPGLTGYALAVAVNAQGIPIRNNALIGNAFVNSLQFADTYGAEAFAANSDAVAVVADGAARMFFDHLGYDGVPNQFAVEVQSPLDAPGQQVVTASLNGDINRSQLNGASQIGTGLVINGNEKPTGSFVNWLTGGCQIVATINAGSPRVAGGMNTIIPRSQTGTILLNVGGAVGLVMTPRTAPWNGIRTLHKTRVAVRTITIPVFAPTC